MSTFQSVLDALFQPWSPRALAVYWPVILQGLLVSVALGLIGCFLVVRGMSLLGDALAHAVLPGIVIGFLIGGSLHSPWILAGATAVGMLAAVLVHYVHSRSPVKEDASLGIVFTAMFALGVLMVNRYAGQADLDPGCVLFGNIEAFVLQPEAVLPIAGITLLIIGLITVFYRQLLVISFDEHLALSLGMPVAAVQYTLLGILSMTVVSSFEAVGAILAVALLIMPGATARLWTDRLPRMLVLSAAFSVLCTLLGYWLSHRALLNTSASGAITLAGFMLFLGSWLFAPEAGLIVRARVRQRVRQMVAIDHILLWLRERAGLDRKVSAAEAELASSLNVSLRGLSKLVRSAARNGLVRCEQGGLVLTDAGQRRASLVARAHVLWERYLQREVGLPLDHVHDPADWIEHVLAREEIDRLDEMLKESAPSQPGW